MESSDSVDKVLAYDWWGYDDQPWVTVQFKDGSVKRRLMLPLDVYNLLDQLHVTDDEFKILTGTAKSDYIDQYCDYELEDWDLMLGHLLNHEYDKLLKMMDEKGLSIDHRNWNNDNTLLWASIDNLDMDGIEFCLKHGSKECTSGARKALANYGKNPELILKIIDFMVNQDDCDISDVFHYSIAWGPENTQIIMKDSTIKVDTWPVNQHLLKHYKDRIPDLDRYLGGCTLSLCGSFHNFTNLRHMLESPDYKLTTDMLNAFLESAVHSIHDFSYVKPECVTALKLLVDKYGCSLCCANSTHRLTDFIKRYPMDIIEELQAEYFHKDQLEKIYEFMINKPTDVTIEEFCETNFLTDNMYDKVSKLIEKYGVDKLKAMFYPKLDHSHSE
jgi:hypothetical protein